MYIRLKLSSFCLALLGSFIFLGCKSNGNSDGKSAITLDSIVDKDSAILLGQSSKGDTATLDYEFHFVYPKGNARVLTNYIATILGREYVGLSPQEIRAKYRANTVVAAKEEYKDADDEYFAHTKPQRINVFSVDTVCVEDKFVSVRYSRSIYEGGAHGYHEDIALNFDTKTGKQITESDLFISGYQEKLEQKILACMDKEFREMLFSDQAEPNGNFMLTDKGIYYYFSPYEIGPYVAGVISSFIPWNELTELIKPYSLGESYL